MIVYVHALGYAFSCAAFFAGGVICGILHERHHSPRHLRRRGRL